MNESIQRLYDEDISRIINDDKLDFKVFNNSKFLVTGANGLIGHLIVKVLLKLQESLNIDIYALVRKAEKLRINFSDSEIKRINIIESDCRDYKYDGIDYDYIIHMACPTDSKVMVEHPVDLIDVSLNGTKAMLDLAVRSSSRSFIYLSSMEVYGLPENDEKIYEDRPLTTRSDFVRNCYPISKILCENLCASYTEEFNISTDIIRLTQAFGPGVKYEDNRIFSQIVKKIIAKDDIVLRTKGETKRNYIYTADAVSAIFTVIINGNHNGDIYNAANESTYCSIVQMCKMAADHLSDGSTKVTFALTDDIKKFGYAPTLHMNLSSDKLNSIGWIPRYPLIDMFSRLMEYYKYIK